MIDNKHIVKSYHGISGFFRPIGCPGDTIWLKPIKTRPCGSIIVTTRCLYIIETNIDTFYVMDVDIAHDTGRNCPHTLATNMSEWYDVSRIWPGWRGYIYLNEYFLATARATIINSIGT